MKVLSTLLLVLVACGPGPGSSLELLESGTFNECPPNPSFETIGPDDVTPDEWTVPITSGPGVGTVSGPTAPDGRRFLRLSTTNATDPAVLTSSEFIARFGAVVMVARAWAGAPTLRLEAKYLDQLYQPVGSVTVSAYQPGSSWGAVAAAVSPPNDARWVLLSIVLVGGTSGQVVDVDALECFTEPQLGQSGQP